MKPSNTLSTMTGSANLVKSKNKDIRNYLHDVSLDGQLSDYSVNDEFETTWEDNEWHDVDFKIDKVKISGESNSKMKEVDYGYLSLRYILNNRRDNEVSLKPNKAWVCLSDGRKLEANSFFDTWENIFSKHKKTYGYIHFSFCRMCELSEIRGIYVEFSGHLLDGSNDKVIHIYEVPLIS